MNSLVLLLAALAPAQETAYKDQLTVDFRKETGNEALIGHLGPWKKTVQEGPDGLRIRLPEGEPKLQTVGVNSKRYIHGNFEITLAYELVTTEKPTSGYGPGVMMWFMMDDPGVGSYLAIARRTLKSGDERYGTDRGSYPDGKHVHQVKFYPTTAREGRLRLVREGTTLKYFVEEPGADGFRLVRVEKDFSTAPVKHSKIGADRGGGTDPLEVVLRELTIRADELSFEATPSTQAATAPGVAPVPSSPGATDTPSRSYGSLAWVVGGAVLAVVLAGGLWLLLRRRANAQEEEEDEDE